MRSILQFGNTCWSFFTESGVKKLQQVLPNCRIDRTYDPGERDSTSGIPGQAKIVESAAASPEPATPKANDQSGETAAAKPADEVSPASDPTATKEGSKTESKPAPLHRLTAEPNADQARVIAEIEKLGGKVTFDEKSPGKPVILVDLAYSKVTDARLGYLTGLTRFKWLILIDTKVTDAGLAHLAGLTQLERLWLDGTGITDAGLAHVAGLAQLQLLQLNTNITDAGLAHIAGLTRLQALYLKSTKITDAGLAHIAGLTHLHDLYLDNTKITNAGLEHLAGLTQLRLLYLDNTKITDAGLAHLAGLTQLQALFLDNTQITDAGLEDLKGMTQLKALVLRGTQVTESGVKKLKQVLPNCNVVTYDPGKKPVPLNLPRPPTAQAERVKTVRVRIAFLMNVLQAYQLDMGDFPTTEQGLQALRVRPAGVAEIKWNGPYLEDVPLDPWHHPYHYRYPSKHNKFVPDIWSLGPDGIDGTADDIGSWMEK